MARIAKASFLSLTAMTLAMALLQGCGGSSPTSPGAVSTVQGTQVNGRLSSSGTAITSATFAQTSFQGVRVHLKSDSAISTEVNTDGSFTLRGLPQQEFILVFKNRNDQSMGELHFDGVLPNTEIDIVIEMRPGGGIRLMDEKRTGIGHGDLELQGLVNSVSPGAHVHEGTMSVNGYTVIARPGVTTIREGEGAREMADLRAGNRVHVKGVWENSSILAHEIKLQHDQTIDSADDGSSCPGINGGTIGQKIVLEGEVVSGGTSNFMLAVNGQLPNGPIQVTFGGTPSCVGQAGKSGKCSVGSGDKVQVKGTLSSCTQVRANEVKIQKKG